MLRLARKTRIIATLLLMAVTTPIYTQAQNYNAYVQRAFTQYLPGTTGFGAVKVEKVVISDQKKTVTVKCNEAASYIPLTDESLDSLKKDILKAMPTKFASYKVTITAGKEGTSLDNLTLYAKSSTLKAPTEKDRFVTRLNVPEAPKGLDGNNIALWQSHGWYFEPKLNRWEWQRARVMQTVEDLYTQSYVMPFLMPMLENAGAYVMSPRERDTNLVELIVDNDPSEYTAQPYTETNGTHQWQTADKVKGFAYAKEELHNGDNPFTDGTVRMVKAARHGDKPSTAAWGAEIPMDDEYAVYVSYASLPNSATDAVYTVHAKNGENKVMVNQQMGGGTWIYLGHFPLAAGSADQPIVELSNISDDNNAVITADAVKIGGGMGNVARIVKEPLDDIDYEYVRSGYPRFTEGARYWLQWAGAPDSVYTPSDNVNDYTDDYRSRGLWVNWLAGGSSVIPNGTGLKIPVDVSLAFHSDAGTTLNDSIIGTLGIYCTVGDKLANGSSRLNSRDFTDLIMTNIVEDVRAAYEPKWTRRGMWDKSYFEARVPEVPAMLLELLSHQNFADMKYGLDPSFRFTVSRAIYKGMLKFIAHRDGRDYVVQPLPVHAFAINNGKKASEYTLSWQPTEDKQEATATPTYYIIEERTGLDGAFTTAAKVTKPEWTATVTDNEIHSYRIIAGNDGGVSFPSEVLALCNMPGKPQVTVVNGFTRVSAPDWFDSGEIAGFYDVHDHGVPYVKDISFIGSQFEYRRHIPWMDDDAAGFGASRADYERDVIAGNTFDFAAVHGEAIRAAGHGFVSTSVEAFTTADPAKVSPIVDLYLGKQKETKTGTGAYGTRHKTFPAALQQQIARLADGGKSFFITGAYVASDLWDNPYSSDEVLQADQKFASEVLGYNWRVDQASVTGEVYEVPSRFRQFGKDQYSFAAELNAESYATESPDSLYPSDDKRGATIMRYSENNLIAGTAFDAGGYRTVVLGFPFETIYDASSRASLMKQVLNFLGDTNKKTGRK